MIMNIQEWPPKNLSQTDSTASDSTTASNKKWWQFWKKNELNDSTAVADGVEEAPEDGTVAESDTTQTKSKWWKRKKKAKSEEVDTEKAPESETVVTTKEAEEEPEEGKKRRKRRKKGAKEGDEDDGVRVTKETMDEAEEVFGESTITGVEKGDKKEEEEEECDDPTCKEYRSRVTKVWQNQNPKVGQNWKQPKKK